MDCSSSSVSNTRAEPVLLSSPRVTPYTPPLRATSSPKISRLGVAVQDVLQRTVDRKCHRHRRVRDDRALTAATSGTGTRPRATASLHGAQWRHDRHALSSCPSSPTSPARSMTFGALGLVALEHLVWRQRCRSDEHLRGAQHGIAVVVGGDLRGAAGRRARSRSRRVPSAAPSARAETPDAGGCAPRRRGSMRRRTSATIGAVGLEILAARRGRHRSRSIQPRGVLTLMPIPLSSQTNSSGIGIP